MQTFLGELFIGKRLCLRQLQKQKTKGAVEMFMVFGIFAVLFGLVCLLVKRETLVKMFKQANEAKGSEVYSDESIEKRIKTVKICGIAAIAAGFLIIIMEITGF